LGIGDWGLGPIPNPQSPIPNPHKNNRIEDALSSLDSAIDIDKNFGDAFNIKGQILLEQNKKDESDKYLETAKQLNNSRNHKLPSYEKNLLAKEYLDNAIKLIESKQYEEAVKCLDDSIKINPNDAIAYFKKGNALYFLNKNN
jgi:tetratricopeptide (TPR) repeat protein